MVSKYGFLGMLDGVKDGDWFRAGQVFVFVQASPY